MCVHVFYNPHSNRPVNRKATPALGRGLTPTLLVHQPKVTSSGRSCGWGSCLLPADATPSMFMRMCRPAAFLLMSPSGLQEQSIYPLKTKTKWALQRPGGQTVCPQVVNNFHGQLHVRIPSTLLLEDPL